MSPDGMSPCLAWNHYYDRVAIVISVMSPVVVGVGRRDRKYREQSG
jgi:hypothetical protein